MDSSPTQPSGVSANLPSAPRSMFTAPCPGCGRAMVPCDATEYVCPPCGHAYRIVLGYLTPIEQRGS